MGIYPDVQMLAPVMPDKFEDREVALTQLRNRLYVRAGSVEDAKLRDAMGELLEDVDGGVSVKGGCPRSTRISILEAGIRGLTSICRMGKFLHPHPLSAQGQALTFPLDGGREFSYKPSA